MELQKVVIKIPLTGSEEPNLALVGAQFTKWIQESSIPGVLIDVADYSHMHEGLGVILAGHEYIFSLDQQEGVNGLRVAYRLNSEDSLASRIKAGYELVRKGADLLASANVPVKVSSEECYVGVADRLNATSSAHKDLLAATKEALGESVSCVEESAPKALPMIKVKL